MMGIDEKIEKIKACLAELQAKYPEAKRYKTNPVLSEETLVEIESALGNKLPANYRAYLAQIGDGGAGFTCFALNSLYDQYQDDLSEESKPFLLTRKWFSPDPYNIELFKSFCIYEENKEFFVELPEDAEPTQGTFGLGPSEQHTSCILVLNGPHAGELWLDETMEDTGPIKPAEPADFLDHMLAWCTEELTIDYDD